MDILVNETPKRTAQNFRINNIKLSENDFPNVIEAFSNLVINASSNVFVKEELLSPFNITYGLGNFLTSQVPNKQISINIESKRNAETILTFDLDNSNANLVDHINIYANPNTSATIILKYKSTGNNNCYHNGTINLEAGENSKINVVVVNLVNEISKNFITIQNKIEENSVLNYTIIDFGGKKSISNFYSNINGNYAKNNINGIYIGKSEQLLDLNYIAELYGSKTSVNIDFQGALLDNAKKYFKGTIDFKRGSVKSVGKENESCMLLSDTAKSLSLPMLLCSEEDVEGAHSSSAGKIDEKELFYVMTRGFNLKESQKLMVRAKFNSILDTITNEDLKNEIIEEINNRLD